jgi:transposase InsO family protein
VNLTDAAYDDNCEALAARSRRVTAAARQRPRRRREQHARRRAVQLCRRLAPRGYSSPKIARRLRIPPRTLTAWRRQAPRQPQPLRGRPCKDSSPQQRRELLQLLETEGAHLGLPTLRGCFPDLPRCEIIDLQRDYRSLYRRAHRLSIEELAWQRPGRVWAVDHYEPDQLIDGLYPAAIAVRDLATGMQLAWLPVRDQTAETTALVLENLFALHGPPLVLKSDNGSAFKSATLEELLGRYRIHWLPSPPRTPRYNGSCEAGIASMQTRTSFQAARHARFERWTTDDLEAARCQANELTRPLGHNGPTRLQLWNARQSITEQERDAFQEAVARHYEELQQLDSAPQDPQSKHQLRRRVLRRVLLELGILTINRRSIPIPLKNPKSAKIS